MFTSIAPTSTFARQDQVPDSKLPHMWIGFIFAMAFFVAEIIEVVRGHEGSEVTLPTLLVGIAGWIYWLFCVYRLHKVLEDMTRGSYQNTPGWAVGGHFLPFYNFYWLFKWPSDFSSFLNSRGEAARMISGALVGIALLVSVLLLRLVDGAIGLAAIFGIGVYLNQKLGDYTAELRQRLPEMQPPPPDFNSFRPHQNQGESVRTATPEVVESANPQP